MTSTAHFVVGAAICRYVPSKPAGLAMALASHFALDAVPHWEDPSLLSGWLGPGALQVWHVVLPVARGLAALTAVGIWWRFGRGDGPWTVGYLVAGGLLALLPDGVTTLLGRHSVVGDLNRAAHWWFEPYRDLVHRPGWPLSIFAVCVTLELATIGAAAWALFRPDRRPDDE